MPQPTRWDRLTALAQLVVWTGAVADLKPESLVIVGPPGHGKTALLKRLEQSPTVEVFSDATVTALLAAAGRAKIGQMTHLAFYELQKLLMRRSSVGEQALGFLASATEDGLENYSIGQRTIHFGGTRFGMLAALTPEAMLRYGDTFRQIGLLTRGLWIEWELSPQEIAAVNRAIAVNDGRAVVPAPVRFHHREKRKVKIPTALAHQVQDYADSVLTHDIRFHKQVIGLVKAAAAQRNATVATIRDLNRVRSYGDFFHRMRRA